MSERPDDESLDVPPPASAEEGVALSTFPGAMRRDWVWREAAHLGIDLPSSPEDKPRR